ncbi:transposase family protein [Streptomyces nigrescens]|uniref:transposase family protein n=1 Tax=Streptomyces nigrescens TaxID=1920 RepID=UPI0034990C3B
MTSSIISRPCVNCRWYEVTVSGSSWVPSSPGVSALSFARRVVLVGAGQHRQCGQVGGLRRRARGAYDAAEDLPLHLEDVALAERCFAVPGRPGLRLGPLADVFAYAEAENVTLRIDGTETQVRRPQAHRPGRRAFVSGKRRQNTIKTTTISDQQGRTLYSGAVRPGRMHDQTAIRTEGIAEQLRSIRK